MAPNTHAQHQGRGLSRTSLCRNYLILLDHPVLSVFWRWLPTDKNRSPISVILWYSYTLRRGAGSYWIVSESTSVKSALGNTESKHLIFKVNDYIKILSIHEHVLKLYLIEVWAVSHYLFPPCHQPNVSVHFLEPKWHSAMFSLIMFKSIKMNANHLWY